MGEVAAGDGEEGGQARLGCQQVIARVVELLSAHVVADGEQSAGGADEESKISAGGELLRLMGDGLKSLRERAKPGDGGLQGQSELFRKRLLSGRDTLRVRELLVELLGKTNGPIDGKPIRGGVDGELGDLAQGLKARIGPGLVVAHQPKDGVDAAASFGVPPGIAIGRRGRGVERGGGGVQPGQPVGERGVARGRRQARQRRRQLALVLHELPVRAKAGEQRPREQRPMQQGFDSRVESEQRGHKVAAVHGRNKRIGIERRAGAGVVPVEEVAAELFQADNGGKAASVREANSGRVRNPNSTAAWRAFRSKPMLVGETRAASVFPCSSTLSGIRKL